MSHSPTLNSFTRRIIIIAFSLTLWLGVFTALGQAQQFNDVRDLPPNQTIEREMTGAETHRYKFDLEANEFFQVRVEQKGVDVELKLHDDKRNVLATMDSPNDKQGPETLSFIADKSSAFVLEVKPLDAKVEKGKYSISREESRTAATKDRRRVGVERVFVEGMIALNVVGQREVALNKLEEAVKGWEVLEDTYLTDLTAVNLFLLANQLPQDLQQEAMKLIIEGKRESLLESRKQSFKALELFRRLYRQLDEKMFADVMVKYSSDKATYKLTTKFGEINILSNINNTYSRTGDFEESTKYCQLAIVAINELRSNEEIVSSKNFAVLKPVLNGLEASLLSSIGTTLSGSLDKPKEALDYLNRSLTLFREIQKEDETSKESAKQMEVMTLQYLGVSYNKLDNIAEALKFFEQALTLVQTMPGQRAIEAMILSNIALVHFSTFNYGKSLFALNQMLRIAEDTGDKALQADALNYIKTIYVDLGDEKALREYSNQENTLLLSPKYFESIATRIQSTNIQSPLSSKLDPLNKSRVVGEFNAKQIDCLRLVRVGNNYKLLEDYDNALKYYEQALVIARGIKELSIEAIITSQVADLYIKRKEWDKAIEYCQRSLAFERRRAIKSDLALSLRDVGYAYLEAGKPSASLSFLNESLALWYSLGADNTATVYRLYGTVLNHLSRTYDALGNRTLAIVFGKLAVNVTQKERGQLRGFDRSLQASYVRKNEKPYRRLANWLIEEGRLLEAEQVLAMLKQEEVLDYLRRDASEADKLLQRADLSQQEAEALKRYNEIAYSIASLGVEFGKLQELQSKGIKLTAEQEKRYTELSTQIEDASRAFQVFLRELAEEFAKRVNVEIDMQENLSLKSDLKSWGKGVVFLYTLVGEDRYRVILVTPETQVDGKSEIKVAELNNKIEKFRAAVQDTKADPRPLGKELYDILIKPVEKQLDGAKAKTLLWSLDGSLRLLPIAALWDGKQYFGQKYRNVTVTLASRTRLGDAVAPNWRALGLGVSEAKRVTEPNGTREFSFPSLPAVKTELRSIVQNAQSPNGVMPGQSLLDADFNEPALETQLLRGYKVIHIASHFSLNPGDSTRSFLLLGDGNVLTVDSIKNNPKLSFSGVELLTLSACQTAVVEKDSSGKEIEGLGYVAQQRGAKAILATLWSVADESTQLLMSEFYRLRKENPQLTKAAALQLAQQEMIEGKLQSQRTTGEKRDTGQMNASGTNAPAYVYDPKKPFAHPYYWSPFILIGNWR
jgi:CHAT domain-containing protein/tetratricopeptide (TPR) repeat protein